MHTHATTVRNPLLTFRQGLVARARGRKRERERERETEGVECPGTHIASADSPCEMMRPFGSNETSSSTSDNLFRSYSDKLLQSGTLHIRTQDDRQWTEPRTAQCGHRQCAGRHNECNNNFCAGVRIQEAFVVFALMIA
jgi:hypothetical protein